MSRAYKERMHELARIEYRLAKAYSETAELCAKRAKVWAEMADGETTNLETGRRLPRKTRPPEPTPDQPESATIKISELDQARALEALTKFQIKRRMQGR